MLLVYSYLTKRTIKYDQDIDKKIRRRYKMKLNKPIKKIRIKRWMCNEVLVQKTKKEGLVKKKN